MNRRKVVITGATGVIATRIIEDLKRHYELVLLDIKNTNLNGQVMAGVLLTDLSDRDRDRYREHFRGADAVLHCAFIQQATYDYYHPERYWLEAANIDMAYNVYMTCLEEDVQRCVVISSNHASDYYEQLIWDDRMEFVTPGMLPLSDNFYGWAKASYELLGFAFACGRIGDRKLQNIQIRIGGPRETDIDSCGDDLSKMHRALGAYLSLRDEIQLITKCIDTDRIEDENGIPFHVFYGVSGNTHNFWSIDNARRIINYVPQDNSQVRFAEKVARIIQAAQQHEGNA